MAHEVGDGSAPPRLTLLRARAVVGKVKAGEDGDAVTAQGAGAEARVTLVTRERVGERVPGAVAAPSRAGSCSCFRCDLVVLLPWASGVAEGIPPAPGRVSSAIVPVLFGAFADEGSDRSRACSSRSVTRADDPTGERKL